MTLLWGSDPHPDPYDPEERLSRGQVLACVLVVLAALVVLVLIGVWQS